MNLFHKLFKQKDTDVNIPSSVHSYYVPDFEKYNEFGQIVPLFEFVMNSDDKIAFKAAEVIHHLFIQKTVFESKQLYDTFNYLRIDKSDIAKFERFPEQVKLTLLCIASVNGNGYSREEALVRLAESKDIRVFPFILFRLADWVKPIREKAEQFIQQYFSPDNALLFIKNHKLILWLLKVERVDLSNLYEEIINCITNNTLDEKTVRLLSDGQRFFYVKTVIQKQVITNEFIDFILRDKYYLNRLLLIRHLDKIDNKRNVILKLIADKSQKVRMNGINWISDQNLFEFRSFLEPMIFDNFATIRITSRNLLNKVGDFDYRNLYKKSIQKDEFLTGSIMGLSEVGDKTDLDLISKYFGSEKPKVKSMALLAMYNLDASAGNESAYTVIENKNPVSTKKIAELILIKQGIEINRLRNIYDKTDSAGKKVILRLINKFGSWSAAGDFLKAMTEKDNELVQLAEIYLTSWEKYTISLGTKQTQEDKNYVMEWYQKAKCLNFKILNSISFIFGEK
jgi:hypothetical protein